MTGHPSQTSMSSSKCKSRKLARQKSSVTPRRLTRLRLVHNYWRPALWGNFYLGDGKPLNPENPCSLLTAVRKVIYGQGRETTNFILSIVMGVFGSFVRYLCCCRLGRYFGDLPLLFAGRHELCGRVQGENIGSAPNGLGF